MLAPPQGISEPARCLRLHPRPPRKPSPNLNVATWLNATPDAAVTQCPVFISERRSPQNTRNITNSQSHKQVVLRQILLMSKMSILRLCLTQACIAALSRAQTYINYLWYSAAWCCTYPTPSSSSHAICELREHLVLWTHVVKFTAWHGNACRFEL